MADQYFREGNLALRWAKPLSRDGRASTLDSQNRKIKEVSLGIIDPDEDSFFIRLRDDIVAIDIDSADGLENAWTLADKLSHLRVTVCASGGEGRAHVFVFAAKKA